MKALRIVWLVLVVGSSLFARQDVFGYVVGVFSLDENSAAYQKESLRHNEAIKHNVPFPMPSDYTINISVPTACSKKIHNTGTFGADMVPQGNKTGIIISVGYTDLPKWYMRVWATSLRDMKLGSNGIEIDDGLKKSHYLIDEYSVGGNLKVKEYILTDDLITPDTKVVRVEMCPRDYYAPWGTIKYFSPTERACIFYIAYIKGPAAFGETPCKQQ